MEHFWDTWKFTVDWYTKQFRYPSNRDAWDLFVAYRRDQRWQQGLPTPAFWMQNHDLDLGLKYDPQRLEESLLQIAAE